MDQRQRKQWRVIRQVLRTMAAPTPSERFVRDVMIRVEARSPQPAWHSYWREFIRRYFKEPIWQWTPAMATGLVLFFITVMGSHPMVSTDLLLGVSDAPGAEDVLGFFEEES